MEVKKEGRGMEGLIAWSTFALAVLTFALVLVAGANFHKFVQNVRLVAKSIDAQKDSIDLQTKTFQLEHRPYLYLYVNPTEIRVSQKKPGEAWYGGGPLRFKNVGRDPATTIKTQYMVASDTLGEIKFVEWFEKHHGGFPDIKSVFPGQEDLQVPCHPMISTGDKKPKLIYIGAVVTYVGPTDTIYWFKYSQIYVINFVTRKNSEGREIPRVELYPLKPDHDWDKNSGHQAPELKVPDWQSYLSKSYIEILTHGTEQLSN